MPSIRCVDGEPYGDSHFSMKISLRILTTSVRELFTGASRAETADDCTSAPTSLLPE